MHLTAAVPYDRFIQQLVDGLNSRARDHRDNHAMHSGMDQASSSGLWLEFGVYQGNTLSMMADRKKPRLVYGFDSFRGLPTRWRTASYDSSLEKYIKKGAFDMSGVPPSLARPNVVYMVGMFNQTLPHFLSDMPNSTISFLHVDCDLYSSALWRVFHKNNATFEIVGHSLNKVVPTPTRDVWPQSVALKLL